MSEQMEGFPGFPAGKLATTPVPNLFFSELLPLIDNLAELKVVLHLFWLIGKKRGALRYARLDELLTDRRLLDGLATPKLTGDDGAARCARACRGARRAAADDRHAAGRETEEWYMINSANGREVLERLQSGELDLLGEAGEDVQLQTERPTVFVLYEQNIGMLTPMIADELRDAERHFPAEWIADAFRQAVLHNKRSWKYVLAHPGTLAHRGPAAARGRSASSGAYDVPDGLRRADQALRPQVTWPKPGEQEMKRLGDLLGNFQPPQREPPDEGEAPRGAACRRRRLPHLQGQGLPRLGCARTATPISAS